MANVKVNQRKGHRAFVTKTVDEVKNIIEAGNVDEEKLLSLQQILEEKVETLSSLDDEILGGFTRRSSDFKRNR